MYSDKTKDVLQNDMLNNISNDYDKTEGSFFSDATKPVAIELEKAYAELDKVVEKININNLTGDELTTRIYERTGISRKVATKATGILTVTGNGTINAGALFESANGVQFKATETKVITSSGTINIECVTTGSIGNLPANQITKIPITIAGITSVNNVNPTSGGYDAETDEDLLKRYFNKIQTPATSGNKAQYRNWALEISGIGEAKVLPLWNGSNTVKVVLLDTNKQPPISSLVTEVQTYIDPNSSGNGEGQAPVGAYCTVVAATPLNINVSATIVGTNATTVKPIFETALTEYLQSIAFVKDVVSIAKIGSILLDSIAEAGGTDYSNLTVNSGTVNIAVSTEQVAVKGTVTLS